MIENRFVTAESSFIDLATWDRCVRPELGAVPSNPSLPVWVGVDASVRHDFSAIVAVTYKDDVVRLVFHRILTPLPNDPINFADIEATLLDLHKRFSVRKVLFDPYQMVATAQRLAKAGVKVEEFPQTTANLTGASQQLFELIQGQALVCYPSEAMRLAASRCIAVESSRGWRLTKERQSHKIDVIVALAMAAYAAVQGQNDMATTRRTAPSIHTIAIPTRRRRSRVGRSLVSGHERRRRRTKRECVPCTVRPFHLLGSSGSGAARVAIDRWGLIWILAH